jgi:hypothetical protein
MWKNMLRRFNNMSNLLLVKVWFSGIIILYSAAYPRITFWDTNIPLRFLAVWAIVGILLLIWKL